MRNKGSSKTEENTESEKITFDKLAQSIKNINVTEIEVTEHDRINSS
jgi:hypothetical protein